MSKVTGIILVSAASTGYLAAFLGMIITVQGESPPDWLIPLKPGLYCIISGGVGGCLYCIRGIYLNACVHNRWDSRWIPWYLLRPIASAICGGSSYLFLHAGLLVLEAKHAESNTSLGFLALAFIAGLNVDKFVARIENLAQSAWGIEQSRASKSSGTDKPEDA